MIIEQRYEALIQLKKDINERINNLDFDKLKELNLWLARSEMYQKLKKEDNQLNMLSIFCNIWLEEKKQLTVIGIEDDIFNDIFSLSDLEKKYMLIMFGILRLETNMQEEYYDQAIDQIIEAKISGIAIERIIALETRNREENVIKVAQMMKERGQIINSIILLQAAEKRYPQNQKICFELSDCWLSGSQWERALECLEKIEEPDEVTLELKKRLGEILKNENV